MSDTTTAPLEAGKERLLLSITSPGAKTLRRSYPADVQISLGRDSSCHVVLSSVNVSRRHTLLCLSSEGIEVEDLSSGGTRYDNSHLHQEARSFPGKSLRLGVGPYEVLVERTTRRDLSAARRREAHGRLLDRLNLEKRKASTKVTAAFRAEVRAALSLIVAEEDLEIPRGDQKRLVSELTDEALGLGPLEALLGDKDVSEIMVVDSRTIYAERSGVLELTGRVFTDDEAVRSAIERIVTPLGRRIDESSPLVDARLPDGSRVNAVIPPLALRGPCITIRKFPRHQLSMEDLVEGDSLNERMARFLQRSVMLKKNIVISGGTGSGKTTLLNILSASIGDKERVVTIEDAAELSLSQAHVVGMEAKPPNLEGRGEFSIRDLVKNALRMRPDRIVVGECRGGEALDMLQAMNTGHEGSMTTTHANSPAQAISRLETLCLMGGVALPLAAIRRQIAESVHLILQQSRMADGSRRITAISELAGLTEEGDVELRPLFLLAPDESTGVVAHHATGFMPSFLPELDRHFRGDPGEIF